jgi:hypothetical protein
VDLYRYFGDGWPLAVKGDGYRYDMAPEDEYGYIFCHMMKHFRFCGIGARQIVDLYVYRKARPDMDEAKVERMMKKLQLSDFYHNIQQLLKVWFEGAPTDPVTELITQYVFTSGSFGTMENKLYSTEVIKAGQKKEEVKNSRAKSLFSALFPSLDLMQLSYNVLYKYPILYPFFCPIRWVDILIHRRKNIGKRLNIIQSMTDEKIENHQQIMNRMGLSLDFAQPD